MNATNRSWGAEMKTKIAIACQGGGSQTAFTAGALKALIEVQEGEAEAGKKFETVSVSASPRFLQRAKKTLRPGWRRLPQAFVFAHLTCVNDC
jgi:hypothetical protein